MNTLPVPGLGRNMTAKGLFLYNNVKLPEVFVCNG